MFSIHSGRLISVQEDQRCAWGVVSRLPFAACSSFTEEWYWYSSTLTSRNLPDIATRMTGSPNYLIMITFAHVYQALFPCKQFDPLLKKGKQPCPDKTHSKRLSVIHCKKSNIVGSFKGKTYTRWTKVPFFVSVFS